MMKFLGALVILSCIPAYAADPDPQLASCLKGSPDCDISQLSPQQMTAVANAARARNLANCETGLTSCDPTRLTREQAANLEKNAQSRNARNCIDGLASCNPQLLGPQDAG